MVAGFMVAWLHVSMVAWFHGSMVAWLHGSMVAWLWARQADDVKLLHVEGVETRETYLVEHTEKVCESVSAWNK
jgi:hypothetical protein